MIFFYFIIMLQTESVEFARFFSLIIFNMQSVTLLMHIVFINEK